MSNHSLVDLFLTKKRQQLPRDCVQFVKLNFRFHVESKAITSKCETCKKAGLSESFEVDG